MHVELKETRDTENISSKKNTCNAYSNVLRSVTT